ncbi:MAG: hypothetical protein ACC662_02715, partial [Planctomycetota bacterium]
RPLAPLAEPLVRAMERTPRRAEALMEALHVLSGDSLPFDQRLWRAWWRRAGQGERRIERAQGRGPSGEGR